MKFSNEAKTGILAVLSILLFIFGYNYLKGKNFFDASKTFYVKYKSVDGLASESDVIINGLSVGKVMSISFIDEVGTLLVNFSVKKDIKFSKNSTVKIVGTGLLGGKSLSIIPVYEQGQFAKSGDTLKGTIERGILAAVSDKLIPLEEKLAHLVVNADSLITALNNVFNKSTQAHLKSSIANIDQTMASFKNASQSIDEFLANNNAKLDLTISQLDHTTKNFANISDSLASIQFAKIFSNLENTVNGLNSIVSKINNGEGSMGKLFSDQKLYDNLEGASRQLEQLLQDLKLNPKRYIHVSIFGKKQKDYKSPTNPKQ